MELWKLRPKWRCTRALLSEPDWQGLGGHGFADKRLLRTLWKIATWLRMGRSNRAREIWWEF